MKEKIKDFFLHSLRSIAALAVIVILAYCAAFVIGVAGKILWTALRNGFNLIG